MPKPILSDAEIKMLPFLGFEALVEQFDDEQEDDERDEVLAALLNQKKKPQGEWVPQRVVLDMSRVISFAECHIEALDETVVEVYMEAHHAHCLRATMVGFMAKLREYRRIREITSQARLLFSAS